jgi:hypothetical protein
MPRAATHVPDVGAQRLNRTSELQREQRRDLITLIQSHDNAGNATIMRCALQAPA